MSLLSLAFTLARRELRGGLAGFRVLVACLALGVAAIAAAGSLRAAFDQSMTRDARALLGGDLDLRQTHVDFSPDERAALAGLGTVTEGIEMRAMALVEGNTSRALVELKGVDAAYPLVGRLELSPDLTTAAALGRRDGSWGAVAEANLLDRLGLRIGDTVKVGDAQFDVRAIITREPDRVATALSLGPRLMIAREAIAATGLIQPGSLVRYTARLALSESDPAGARKALAERFPHAAWQLRDPSEAAPGIGRFLDTLTSFLSLVGLTALLVGGIGIANAVTAYLDGKIATIATLKCLGAPARLILLAYGLLVAALSLAGIALGLAAGAAVVPLVLEVGGDALPLLAEAGLYPAPLLVTAGFGILSAGLFTLWPLARARRIPAAVLFRGLDLPRQRQRDRAALVALVLIGATLAALTVLAAGNRPLAAWFVAAALVTMAVFRLLAWGLAKGAAALSSRHRALVGPTWRLALANLHRPGSAVVGMVMSLGLGLSVLVTIALVEGNLAAQFGERMPAQAPSFFFIDIQPDQVAALDQAVHDADPEAKLEQAAMVRGRISSIRGIPIGQARIAPEAEWAARGDRGLSSARLPPPGSRVVEGHWWPPDYAGPPLASVDAAVARGFGLVPGDRLGLNVLGREIEVEVASLRQIDWAGLGMNFAFLLSPGALDGAPFTVIATVHARPDRDGAVEKAVTDRLANVSAIRVKEALEAVRALIAKADLAVRLAGAVTLAAGALVLAGAVAAGQRRRVRDAVVMKVLGATRRQLWRAHLAEFAAIGLATGLCAACIATLASRAILIGVMKADWTFLPGTTALTLAACIGASLLAGFAGTWRALGVKVAPLLRNE